MRFTLTIDCDNAAFEKQQFGQEIARILRDAAERMDIATGTITAYPLYDVNGNRVGSMELKD